MRAEVPIVASIAYVIFLHMFFVQRVCMTDGHDTANWVFICGQVGNGRASAVARLDISETDNSAAWHCISNLFGHQRCIAARAAYWPSAELLMLISSFCCPWTKAKKYIVQKESY